jgi:hypothetical protein
MSSALLDSVAYQVERRLAQLGDSAAPQDRARAEMLVTDARQAVKARGPDGPGAVEDLGPDFRSS